MKSHPCEVTAKTVKTLKIAGIKLEKGTFELRMGHPFKINLEHYMGKDAEYKRNNQPFESLTEEPAAFSELQRIKRTLSCKDKEYRHNPLDEETDKEGHTHTLRIIFNVPAVVIKKACTMKKKNRQHCQAPQPVNIVTSFGF